MKIKLEMLLDARKDADALLTFEFKDWIDFKDFLRSWFKYCTAKTAMRPCGKCCR